MIRQWCRVAAAVGCVSAILPLNSHASHRGDRWLRIASYGPTLVWIDTSSVRNTDRGLELWEQHARKLNARSRTLFHLIIDCANSRITEERVVEYRSGKAIKSTRGRENYLPAPGSVGESAVTIGCGLTATSNTSE